MISFNLQTRLFGVKCNKNISNKQTNKNDVTIKWKRNAAKKEKRWRWGLEVVRKGEWWIVIQVGFNAYERGGCNSHWQNWAWTMAIITSFTAGNGVYNDLVSQKLKK